jgi:hypothetical protein
VPSKILVKAGPNGPVFMEGITRRLLDENGKDMNTIGEEPLEVDNTSYYRRRIAKGDLIAVEAAAPAVVRRPTSVGKKHGEE